MRRRSNRKWVKKVICCVFVLLIVIVYVQLSFIFNIADLFQNIHKDNLRKDQTDVIPVFPYSLTLVTVCDSSQLWNLNYVINAWLGPLSVGLAVFPSEMEYIDEHVKDLLLPSRVVVSKINALRNLAASAASTTHIFIADADVLPSLNLLDTFLSLPIPLLHDPYHAFIVPLFEVPFKSIPCNSWFACIDQSRQYLRLDRKELVLCLRFGGCRSLGAKDANNYMPRGWDSLPASNHSTPLHCWDNPFQEPFVIVSKASCPQFDEDFVDYGYNKVQWITLLRYSGFKFSVLSNSWAFHMRHNPSLYQKRSLEKSDPERGKKGGVNTKKIFDRVLKRYESLYANQYRLPICVAAPNVRMVESSSQDTQKGKKKRKIKRTKKHFNVCLNRNM